jgi:hypothetical protein
MPLIYISKSPLQVGRCSQHFQLGMNNTKVHQTNENTRRNAKKYISCQHSHQWIAYPTKRNHNLRFTRLEEEATNQCLTIDGRI